MKNFTFILCAIFLAFIGYSAFRIKEADASQMNLPASSTIASMQSFTNTKNTIYDKYLSSFNYCQPVKITNISQQDKYVSKEIGNDVVEEFKEPFNILNLKTATTSNILLFSKKNLSNNALNNTTLKDTNILVLKEIGTSPEFDFSIYDTNSLIQNNRKPMISGTIENNKILSSHFQ